MQTWQEDLRNLMRQPPEKEIRGLIQKIMKGRIDDRSAALTCGSLAEVGLAMGIASVKRLKQDEIVKQFWSGRGDYFSFKAKIKEAATVGLIGPTAKSNLDVVRQVRNVFAHAMFDVRFTSPAVKSACDVIQLPPGTLFATRVRSRKSRFFYCTVCDQVFRRLLGYASTGVVFGIPPSPPHEPLLP